MAAQEEGRPEGRPTTHASLTGLGLLNEQLIAANIARYVATKFIDTVIDRMAYLRVTPEFFQTTLETLRAEMHAEVDRLIDEAVAQ